MTLDLTQKPPPLLVITFLIATGLKLVGILVAMVLSAVLVRTPGIDRWWMALLTGFILLLLLVPLHLSRQRFRPQQFHKRLIMALAFAIFAPQLDLIQSSWTTLNPVFLVELGWISEQVHDIHAMGALFMTVPVVLGSWQYGRFGMVATLTLSGILYLLLLFLIPPGTFTIILYLVRGFVMLGVCFILGLTIETLSTAQKQEQAALEIANNRLAQANQKLAEQAAVMEELATSRERNRLARELHDTLAHSLSATAVQLQAVQTLLKVDPEAAADELKQAQQQIKEGLKESRRAITALRASPLEELGLMAALQQRAANLGERSGLTIHCQFDEVLPPLPPHTEQTLYRVADEAMMNVEKHAQASDLFLSLQQVDDAIILQIQDNGVGFEGEGVAENGRYGLLGLQERADLIGAALTIHSVPDEGTLIQLRVSQLPNYQLPL
jgi:signal transduction histidine kinase